MKKATRLLSLLLLAVCLMPFSAFAQGMEDMFTQQLPLDPDVRIGKLDNGLTYYIRHNEMPKGQADFRIAQKVGSALEEDNQRGLAHFLEHMCFNGTQNFPGSGIIDWLRTIGVSFGNNLNAYTGVDETVYRISNVPVARKSVQDSCLLILHDWADGLLLEDEEIDKERGVIHEEWRQSNQGQMRILERLLPVIYPDSRYGHRLPIGTMEVVDNFPYQALRDYYETWYRPDQQAIIVVGDIDVDYIEGKIKEMFSPIKMPANPKKREYFPVPDHKGMIIAMGTDPEQKFNLMSLSFISDPMPRELKNTLAGYMNDYMESIISMMLNNRFADIASKADAPFAQASASFGGFMLSTETKDALDFNILPKGNDLEPALKAVYREILRAQRHGFTEGEYDRAKSELMSRIERLYNNRKSTDNEAYSLEYVNNFIHGDAMPGIEMDYQIYQQISAGLPLQAINQVFAETITKDNRIFMLLGTEGANGVTVPEEKQVVNYLESVEKEDIEPFVDEVRQDPFIPVEPTPGKIVKTKALPQWGAIEWTLSNGVKVIVKKTDFKQDQILMDAQAMQGTAMLGPDFDLTVIGADAFTDNSLGTYTARDIRNYLQGKQAGVSYDFGTYMRDITGHATPKDLQTLMELVYMTFTQFGYDAEEFKANQSQLITVLENQALTPEFQFSELVQKTIRKSPRGRMIDADIVKQLTPEDIVKYVKAMTANAADYTFTFVGNVDPQVLRPLVEKYIASLPGDAATATKAPESFNPDYFITPGSEVTEKKIDMKTPTTYCLILESGSMPKTAKDRRTAMIAGEILSKHFLKTVREDMGAVYSIFASGSQSRVGDVNAMVVSQFPMKPEMRQQVLDFIAGQFKDIENNVTEAEVAEIKELMVKEANESLEKNESWLGGISGWLIDGEDSFNNAVAIINSITPADIQNYMRKLNAQNNYRVIMLSPTEAPADAK